MAPIVFSTQKTWWNLVTKNDDDPNGIKLGKSKGRGYSKFRYLQFNNFAISTLFRA